MVERLAGEKFFVCRKCGGDRFVPIKTVEVAGTLVVWGSRWKCDECGWEVPQPDAVSA